jgi:hypothetical protein
MPIGLSRGKVDTRELPRLSCSSLGRAANRGGRCCLPAEASLGALLLAQEDTALMSELG